jgi:hypothetical protein
MPTAVNTVQVSIERRPKENADLVRFRENYRRAEKYIDWSEECCGSTLQLLFSMLELQKLIATLLQNPLHQRAANLKLHLVGSRLGTEP